MRMILLAAILIWTGVGPVSSCFADRSTEFSPEKFSNLSMSALAEICSNQLQNVGATRDSVRSNAQMRAALNAIGRKGTAEGVTVLKEVLAHPAAKDSVKEEALRALYRVTGKDALVRPWIDSGNDQLRATALELLAPVLIGDPSLDKTIEKMMAKWLEEYSRTRTGTVLRSIRQMREFREDYEAEKHPKKKIDLLVSNIL